MANTEDKHLWVLRGEELERAFISKLAPRIGLEVCRNPEKEKDPYAPDMLIDKDRKPADLKCQRTPFFSIRKLYPYMNFDPTYTVTFNVNDYERYSRDYPTIHIVFWVKWLKLEERISGEVYKVEPIHGVWRCTLSDISVMVQNLQPHRYLRRKGDTRGNARASFPLDLRQMTCVWCDTPSR